MSFMFVSLTHAKLVSVFSGLCWYVCKIGWEVLHVEVLLQSVRTFLCDTPLFLQLGCVGVNHQGRRVIQSSRGHKISVNRTPALNTKPLVCKLLCCTRRSTGLMSDIASNRRDKHIDKPQKNSCVEDLNRTGQVTTFYTMRTWFSAGLVSKALFADGGSLPSVQGMCVSHKTKLKRPAHTLYG